MARLARRERATETSSDPLEAATTATVSRNDEDGGYAKPSSGWGAFKNTRKATSSSGGGIGKEDWWKPSEDEALVRFMEDEPFASYVDVWVPNKRRSYSSLNPENPLVTKLDLSPQPRATFNVLIFNPTGPAVNDIVPGTWELKVLRAASILGDKIEAMHEHPKHGPISKHYWEMTATGTKKNYSVNMQVVKEDDLVPEWGVTPPTDEEMAEFRETLRSRNDIFIHSDEDLDKVVREVISN